MNPQNAVIGDANYGTELPQTQPSQQDFTREINMAKFSKTKEFKILKEAMGGRIEYWKAYTPGSANPTQYRELTNEERGWRTLVADVLIEEFNSILGAYEQAGQVVAEMIKK